jgi:hypothetical protein
MEPTRLGRGPVLDLECIVIDLARKKPVGRIPDRHWANTYGAHKAAATEKRRLRHRVRGSLQPAGWSVVNRIEPRFDELTEECTRRATARLDVFMHPRHGD